MQTGTSWGSGRGDHPPLGGEIAGGKRTTGATGRESPAKMKTLRSKRADLKKLFYTLVFIEMVDHLA